VTLLTSTVLPTPLTSFIGRTTELTHVARLLDSTRLVTLSGPGGVGKTRLALHAASLLREAFSDGVCVVELAAVREPAQVVRRVAAALRVVEDPDRGLVQSLVDALRSREMLLVLDNCEQVRDACAELVVELIGACPWLRVLATSRDVLRIHGEAVVRVPSLDTDESTRLFVERARLAKPEFALSECSAHAVAEICRRLDGIPLAIELAAARINVLSPSGIASRLDERFKLLSVGTRGVLPRHQTLRALIDWDYELLDPVERDVFNRLSVFAGGWTLEAAEAVCGDIEQTSQLFVLDVLTSLIDKSLVVAEAHGDDAIRYRMLETLREYGQLRLGRCDAVGRQHAAYYLALAERAEPELTGPHQATWLSCLDAERENLRGALRWLAAAGCADEAWRLSGALWRFWSKRGYFAEGRELLSLALGLDVFDASAARAKALQAAGNLAAQQGDYAAAEPLYEEALAVRRALGDRPAIGNLLSNLGIIARYQGNNHAARRLYTDSLAIRRELDDTWGIATSLANLGIVMLELGKRSEARCLHEESLDLRRRLGDRWAIANSLHNLANVARDDGDFNSAFALYAESIAENRALGDRLALAYLLEDVACLCATRSQSSRALRLAAAATALRSDLGARLSPAEQSALDRRLATAGASAVESQPLSLDEALDLALSPLPEPSVAVGPWSELTPREREVADLIARGLTNRQIAAALVVGDKTVETHVAHILAKLGFSRRAQIIVQAAQHAAAA
jgi:predicted ATPase/DNA-binding CsgD family transcriptional regulator